MFDPIITVLFVTFRSKNNMNIGIRRCTCIVRQIGLVGKLVKSEHKISLVSRNISYLQQYQQRLPLPVTSLVISQRSASKKSKSISWRIYYCFISFLCSFIFSKLIY